MQQGVRNGAGATAEEQVLTDLLVKQDGYSNATSVLRIGGKVDLSKMRVGRVNRVGVLLIEVPSALL
jgi:hypothetical protein